MRRLSKGTSEMTKTVADPFAETLAAAGVKGATVARTAALPILTAESGLTRYLKEIRRFPMLEQQDEYMLAKRWREHGDRDAAHKLVTSHLRLVAKIAMGYRGYGLREWDVISSLD
jgi:DNA-directed RNA polymerase sigma subunit (sigma70/sigma32)